MDDGSPAPKKSIYGELEADIRADCDQRVRTACPSLSQSQREAVVQVFVQRELDWAEGDPDQLVRYGEWMVLLFAAAGLTAFVAKVIAVIDEQAGRSPVGALMFCCSALLGAGLGTIILKFKRPEPRKGILGKRRFKELMLLWMCGLFLGWTARLLFSLL